MTSLKELNRQSWTNRLEARAHTYKLHGRFRFAFDRLMLRRPGHWLDLGTGNGFLPGIVRSHLPDVRVIGTDFADNALRAADSLHGRALTDLDHGSLPFRNNSFDFITCLEVIEHLIFPERVLAEMHRVLRPGGYAVVTVPNLQFVEYLGQLARGKMPGPAADSRHLSVFTQRHLGEQMERAGLALTHRGGCDPSMDLLGKVSPRFFCRTIALEARKAA